MRTDFVWYVVFSKNKMFEKYFKVLGKIIKIYQKEANNTI